MGESSVLNVQSAYRPLLCRYAPVEEYESDEQDYDGHGHDAPHEALVGLADVVSHSGVYII